MSYKNPLLKLISNNKDEDLKNIYDDGSVWSLPEEPSSSYNPLIYNKSSFTMPIPERISIQDPLQGARNQVQYFTNQLDKLGVDPVAPDTNKERTTAFDWFNRVFAPVNAIPNAVTGGLEGIRKGNLKTQQSMEDTEAYKKMKSLGYSIDGSTIVDSKNGKRIKYAPDEINDLYKQAWKESKGERSTTLDYLGNIGKESVSSFFNTFKDAWKGTEDQSDIYNIMSRLEQDGTEASKNRRQTSSAEKLTLDIAFSVATGGFTDIDGAGKMLKYLRNSDKYNKIDDLLDVTKATELAKKSVSYDDVAKKYTDKGEEFIKSAYERQVKEFSNQIINTARKASGGIDYEGIKAFGKTITKDSLNNLMKNETLTNLTKAGLSFYSPVSALLNNPVLDTISKQTDKIEEISKAKDFLNNKFKGGKYSLEYNSIPKEPDKALEYADSIEFKKMQDQYNKQGIKDILDEIEKASNEDLDFVKLSKEVEQGDISKETIQEITETKKNPEYIKKLYELGSNEGKKIYKESINKLKRLQYLKDKAKGEDLDRLLKQTDILETRLKDINAIETIKSIDFKKQLNNLGINEADMSKFEKALSQSMPELVKTFDGNIDVAEKYKLASNAVLDLIEETYPELKGKFRGVNTVDMAETFKDGNASKYFDNKVYENISFEHEIARIHGQKQKEYNKIFGKTSDIPEKVDVTDMSKTSDIKNPIPEDVVRFDDTKQNLLAEERVVIKKKIKELNLDMEKGHEEFIDNMNYEQLQKYKSILNSKYLYRENSKKFINGNKNILEYMTKNGEGITQDDNIFTILKKLVKDRVSGKITPNFKYNKMYHQNDEAINGINKNIDSLKKEIIKLEMNPIANENKLILKRNELNELKDKAKSLRTVKYKKPTMIETGKNNVGSSKRNKLKKEEIKTNARNLAIDSEGAVMENVKGNKNKRIVFPEVKKDIEALDKKGLGYYNTNGNLLDNALGVKAKAKELAKKYNVDEKELENLLRTDINGAFKYINDSKYNEYVTMVENLTDDEVDMLKDYFSNKRNIPDIEDYISAKKKDENYNFFKQQFFGTENKIKSFDEFLQDNDVLKADELSDFDLENYKAEYEDYVTRRKEDLKWETDTGAHAGKSSSKEIDYSGEDYDVDTFKEYPVDTTEDKIANNNLPEIKDKIKEYINSGDVDLTNLSINSLKKKFSKEDIKLFVDSVLRKKNIGVSELDYEMKLFKVLDELSANYKFANKMYENIDEKTIDRINKMLNIPNVQETIFRNKKLLDKLNVNVDKFKTWTERQLNDFYSVVFARDNIKAIQGYDVELGTKNYEEIAKITDNFTKVNGSTMRYIKKLSNDMKFELERKGKKTSLLNKLIPKDVRENLNLGEMSAYKFEHNGGIVNIDTALDELNHIDLSNDLDGVTVNLSKDLGVQGLQKGDNIAVDMKSNNPNAVLEHEITHMIDERFGESADKDAFIEGVKNTIKGLSKESHKALKELINSIGVDETTMRLLSNGTLTKAISLAKNKVSNLQGDKELIATLGTLFSNSNEDVRNKTINLLGKSTYDNFKTVLKDMPKKDFQETYNFIRTNVSEEYADIISKNREFFKSIGSSKEEYRILTDAKNKVDEINDALRFTDSDIITDVEDSDRLKEWFKKNNPDMLETLDSKIPEHIEVNKLVPMVEKILLKNRLGEKELDFVNKYIEAMSDLAIKDGIYKTKEEAKEFMTYVMHSIHPDYRENQELIDKVTAKFGNVLEDFINPNSLHRKGTQSIEEKNFEALRDKEIGVKIFDDNIARLWIRRQINSDNFWKKENAQNRLIENFGITYRNFRQEAKSIENLFPSIAQDDWKTVGIENINQAKKEMEYFGDTFDEYVKRKFGTKEIARLSYKSADDMLFEELDKLGLSDKVKHNFVLSGDDSAPLHDLEGKPYINLHSEREKFKTEGGTDKDWEQVVQGYKDKGYAIHYSKDGVQKHNGHQVYNDYFFKEAKKQGYVILKKDNGVTTKEVTKITKGAIADVPEGRNAINSMVGSDMKSIEGFDATSGYTVIKNGSLKTENLEVLNPKDYIIVKETAWKAYNNVLEEMTHKDKSTILKIYDKVLNMFKSNAVLSVTFHKNNMIGNAFNSYITAGVNVASPKYNSLASKIRNGKDGEIAGVSFAEIRDYVYRTGLMETQMGNEFDYEAFSKGKIEKLMPKKKTPLEKIRNVGGTPWKASQKLGQTIEEQAKLVNFLTHLENGFSMADAEMLTKKALFDYSDITGFETEVMKRIVPFYTFIRKNVPLQLDNIQNRAGAMSRVTRVQNNMEQANTDEKERKLRPEYMDNYTPLGNGKYINMNLPMTGITDMFDPKTYLSAITPVAKTPLELVLNKKLYSGEDISRTNDSKEKFKYAINSLIPSMKLADNINKSLTSKDVNTRRLALEGVLRTFGQPIQSFDIAKAEKQTMYEYVTQLENQYYELLEKNPELKQVLEEQKQSSKNKYVSPLKKLVK